MALPAPTLADRESPPHPRRVFLPVAASFARKLNIPDDASSVDSLDDRRYSDVPSVRSVSLARAKRESNALQRSRELSALQPTPPPAEEEDYVDSTPQPRELSNFQERAYSNLQPRRELSNLNLPTSSIGPSTSSSIGTQSISLAAIPFNHRRTQPATKTEGVSPPPTPTHRRKAPLLAEPTPATLPAHETKVRRSWRRRLLPKFFAPAEPGPPTDEVKISSMRRRPTESSRRGTESSFRRRREDSTAVPTMTTSRHQPEAPANARRGDLAHDDTMATRSPRRTEHARRRTESRSGEARSGTGWGACLPTRSQRRHSRLQGDRPRDGTASYSRLPRPRACAACGGGADPLAAEPHSFGGFRQKPWAAAELPEGSSVSSGEWDVALRAPSNLERRRNVARALRFR